MKNLVRDAPFGQLMRYITSDRVFKYPEEEPGFQWPASYTDALPSSRRSSHANRSTSRSAGPPVPADVEKKNDELSSGSSTETFNAGAEEPVEESLKDIEKIS